MPQTGYTIQAPVRYPWRFNSPKDTPHHIAIRPFIPFNKISGVIEGITVFAPVWGKKVHLIHAFNRIPLGRTPFVISFESYLPRLFKPGWRWLFRWMTRRLKSPRCRAIIAISHYAKQQFRHMHSPQDLAVLEPKLRVQYPNIVLPGPGDEFAAAEDAPMRLLFVGNHFVRKGGEAAIRLCQLAQASGLGLELHIISALQVGAMSWVDPLREGHEARLREQMAALPGIHLHGPLPNEAVKQHMQTAHFHILPTLSDSFGYSVIEAMAHYTPVIATAQGALPEMIRDGENGILLPLAVNERQEWRHIGYSDRHSDAYWQIYQETVAALADTMHRRLQEVAADWPGYLTMREQARHTAQTMFDSRRCDPFWNRLYSDSIEQTHP